MYASGKYIDTKVEALDTANKQKENGVSKMEKLFANLVKWRSG